jgi:curved DNA-binding protein
MPGTHPGDQLVELSIHVPLAEDDKQRAAYAALQETFQGYDPRQ